MHLLSRAVRTYSANGPYYITADWRSWKIVRRSSGSGDRRVVAERLSMAAALRLVDELNRAWAEDPSRLD